MKVARESSLRQCQVLHLGRCLLVSFLVGEEGGEGREGREEREERKREGRSGREEERKERKRGEEKGEEKSGMVEEDG